MPYPELSERILQILQSKPAKPAEILDQLRAARCDEKNARKAIADLIERNEVVFDPDWRLKANAEMAAA